jgi:serine/threonine protein kinase
LIEMDGQPYFVVEFVEGGGLDQKLQEGALPPRQAAALLETVARAVCFMHRRGVVHRNLKPRAVLLTADGTPKIGSFSLAKRYQPDEGILDPDPEGAIAGTPSYMAPEQASGRIKEVGPAADVYALGGLLYEMLTGQPPIKGTTVIETIRKVINEEPLAPSRLSPRVPRDLDAICLKCLEKTPEKRYHSAEELAEDLRRFQNREPIRARPVGAWERMVLWARRRPATAALWCLSVLTLFMMTGITLFLYGAKPQPAPDSARPANKDARELKPR